MPCPRCVGECRCTIRRADLDGAVLVDPESYDPSEEQFSQSLVSARLPQLREPAPVPSQNDAADPEIWRREVAQRVTRFKSRRGYPENSLSFDFETAPQELVSAVAPAAYAAGNEVREQEAANDPPSDIKVIEFPRSPASAGSIQAVAESVEELPPRIFEAEATEAEAAEYQEEIGDNHYSGDDEEPLLEDWNTSVAIAPLLPSFTLDPGTPGGERAVTAPVDLPLQIAPAGLRACVVLLDALIAVMAAGLFSFVAYQFGALPPEPKMLLLSEIFVVMFFWFAYQLLYLTYAGATLGMALTRVDLCTFEGYPVSRWRRQARALSMLLSALAAGMGFAWAFLDEDTLCWHDRITRTVLR